MDETMMKRLKEYIQEHIQVACEQEAERLLQQARRLTPPLVRDGDLEILPPGYWSRELEEDMIIEGSLTPIIEEPTRLLGEGGKEQ